MAIFLCKGCNHTQEVDNKHINKKAKCPKCEYIVTVYDTVPVLKNILKRYHELNFKLKDTENKLTKIENLNNDIIKNNSIHDIDIHNTKSLMHKERYLPIVKWFKDQNIKVKFTTESIDTTGFFDEVALLLGDNYSLF